MKLNALLLIGAPLIAAGCSTHNAYVQNVPLQNVELAPLQKTDYKVLGTVEGESCAERHIWPALVSSMLGLPLPVAWAYDKNTGLEQPFTDIVSTARASALQQATKAQPGTDALLFPKYEETTTSWVVYSKYCAKVTAKAIAVTLK